MNPAEINNTIVDLRVHLLGDIPKLGNEDLDRCTRTDQDPHAACFSPGPEIHEYLFEGIMEAAWSFVIFAWAQARVIKW